MCEIAILDLLQFFLVFLAVVHSRFFGAAKIGFALNNSGLFGDNLPERPLFSREMLPGNIALVESMQPACPAAREYAFFPVKKPPADEADLRAYNRYEISAVAAQ
jgi:hypothetical protein